MLFRNKMLQAVYSTVEHTNKHIYLKASEMHQPDIVHINSGATDNHLAVGVQRSGCQELDDLVDALLVAVHLPVATNKELARHFIFNLKFKAAKNNSVFIKVPC